MDYASAEEQRWQGHPWLARILRLAIGLFPVGLSVTMSLLAAHFLPPYRLGLNKWVWWVIVGAVSTAALLGADRLMRRLLPLTALLKMTLIFPDHAPSRLKLAMRTGTTRQLERLVAQSKAGGTQTLEIDRASAMLELVAALSAHDRLTRGHCERVRAYTDLVVKEMHLPEHDANLLRWSALLHDVGKLRVPQEILTSDRRPTDEEWRILATHPAEGMALTESLDDWLGEWRRTIGEHHERFDGKGYPNGLRGAQIHLGARIVAVTDAFDVMTSARSYKKPIPASAAREEVARCSGSQFDPAVVRAFLNIGLRRLQFALGPLAWLSNLPFIGQAPVITAATNALGGVATAGVLTAATLGGVAPAAAQSAPARPPAVHSSPAPAPNGSSETTVLTPVPGGSTGRLTATPGQSGNAPAPDDRSAESTTSSSIGSANSDPAITTVPNSSTTLAAVPNVTTTVATRSATTTIATTAPPSVTTTTVRAATTVPTTAPATTAAPTTTDAPTTTSPITTTDAPTTTAPGTTLQVLYFTGGGLGDRSLTTTKPATSANEPDVDGDGRPGLTLKKGANNAIAWSGPLTLGQHLMGPVVVDLWSAVNNFNGNEQGTLQADLQVCDLLGLNCTTVLSNQWTYKPWAVNGSGSWTERQLVIGTLDTTVGATGKLRVVLTAVERDMQIAMSGDRPSSLQVTVPA